MKLGLGSFGRKSISAAISMLFLLTSIMLVGNASGNVGTPDAFGYYWTDSNGPAPQISFDWIEVNLNGTMASLIWGDDSSGIISIGFNFTFYGNVYTNAYASTNGFLSFGTGSSTYNNAIIPSSSTPNNIAAAYWDDLDVNYGSSYGHIYYQTIGSAPNRQFIVEYWEVTHHNAASPIMTFETILSESSNMITFQYLSMGLENGNSATVGIEDSLGTTGCQYSFNTPAISDGLAICFQLPDTTNVFVPPHFDYPVDSDSDSLYNYLVLGINVSITNDGWYEIDAFLNDSSSNSIDFNYSAQWLTAGTYTVEIWFDGWLINEKGLDGPYDVDLRLWVYNGIAYDVCDTDLYTTHTYTHNQFFNAPPSAYFTPPYTDFGYDDDANSDFDFLVVNASLNVTQAGEYLIEGYLYDNSWIEIAHASNLTNLSMGDQSVGLFFPGADIFASMVDGPYIVWIDLCTNSSGTVLIDSDFYATTPYLYTDFEKPARLQPPYSDFGVDTNSNGLYDKLVVEISVNVTIADVYTVYGWLNLSSSYSIDWAVNASYLAPGLHTVDLEYSYMFIYDEGYNGTFDVYLELRDGAYRVIDTDLFVTSSYTFDQFDYPSHLQPPQSEYPVDSDSDGLFEYIIVNATVDIDYPGMYKLIVEVATNSTPIALAILDENLSSGQHTIQISVPSGQIVGSGSNGPYIVLMALFGGSGGFLDMDFFLTRNYTADEFDSLGALFLTPFNDFGRDTNSNGLYEYLVLQIPVNVTVAGIYNISGTMFGGPLGAFTSDANVTYLPVGNHTVELRFDGGDIYNYSISSSFLVNLNLRNATGALIDSYFNITNYYDFFDFDVIDVIPPTTLIIPAGMSGSNGWYTSNVTVTLPAFDLISGINRTMYRVNGWSWTTYALPFNITTNGNNSVEFYSVDNALNVESTRIAYMLIDRIAPTTLSHSFNYTLLLAPIDNAGGSGVDVTEFRVYNDTAASWSSWGQYTGTVKVGNSGNFTVEFYSIDKAGNDEYNISLHSISMPIKDIAPPVTTPSPSGTSGASGWFKSNVNLTLSAADAVSGVNFTMYRLDGGSWTNYTGRFAITGEGNHTVYFYSKDYAGNIESTKSTNVKIDTIAPVIAIVQANGTAFNTTNVLISWTASDVTSGIDHFMISVDGGTFETLNSTTLSKILTLTNGSHYVIVRAYDVAGLMTEKRIDITVAAYVAPIEKPPIDKSLDLLSLLLVAIIVIAALISLFVILNRRKKDDEGGRNVQPFDSQNPPQSPPPSG